ncbi:hypothetical protein [Sphaerisporangium dianthi]|uniref:Uncharacterized protein n=1 Tax=Sphaerisporangium dianthi TaxID=1436120 RepID=A0ABV9CU39_9ACTN
MLTGTRSTSFIGIAPICYVPRRAAHLLDHGGGLRRDVTDLTDLTDRLCRRRYVVDETARLSCAKSHVRDLAGHAGQRHQMLVLVVDPASGINGDDIAFPGRRGAEGDPASSRRSVRSMVIFVSSRPFSRFEIRITRRPVPYRNAAIG